MYRVLAGLFLASALFGETTPFYQLQQEAARTKTLLAAKESLEGQATDVKRLHAALRDWVESRLPQTPGPSGAELRNLETSLQVQLRVAGLSSPDSPNPDDATRGSVEVKFQWLPELPDALIVITSVTIECGADEAFYLYQFNAGKRTRVLEESSWGYTFAGLQLSDPDSQGRRLLLTYYMSVQCQSTWMQMAYSVHGVSAQPKVTELLIADQHGFWLGNDGPYFVLKPNELIVEFLDSSVDVVIHNRTQIHRYSFVADAQRLDPVALQPQDFAEEWRTRPWSEMESRSAADTKAWHPQLHGDYVLAEYSGVVPCADAGQWLIGLDIMRSGQKEHSDPQTTYFLVRDLGNHTYFMDAVAKSKPATCLGDGIVSGAGFASDKHPWLSTAELKALR